MPKVTGCISASFTEAGGQTRLSDRYHAYPLKIAKAFPFDHGQLGVYIMDASPGIMGGDEYVLDWRFGENTNVFITNQSYTKVHPARGEGMDASTAKPSRQQQKLILHSGSYVEYMPEPLMLYKDSILYTSTEVHMEPGSVLIYSDTVCPGRTHRGELFHYEKYQNQLTVHYDGELIYCAKQRVCPAEQKLHSLGSWSGYTHTGSLCIFSDRVDAAFIESLRDFIEQLNTTIATQERTVEPSIPLYYGVSRTYKYGLVLSVMGHKVYQIQSLLDGAWQFTRQHLFAKPELYVRK
ncbi:urease accessory protein UreD [Paenibacillus radicis (ex Xue et al. 2023)]|uniref:Urease accessory protein UreD n=1 Tax=Paenibacillus radicis (ex Xue et al. 2023) TaxID=2972489 RepID=A0ABT1YBZ3_9BACL|nr:urease accessory protein UreD [Paenibacillus radicis (ex Xue et al. 2023)]MCR8629924.1 urease accessory protein UreD [Paenibacillus radicis (ex Xue et al. 2023)]